MVAIYLVCSCAPVYVDSLLCCEEVYYTETSGWVEGVKERRGDSMAGGGLLIVVCDYKLKYGAARVCICII
jgi:hypothetical protein